MGEIDLNLTITCTMMMVRVNLIIMAIMAMMTACLFLCFVLFSNCVGCVVQRKFRRTMSAQLMQTRIVEHAPHWDSDDRTGADKTNENRTVVELPCVRNCRMSGIVGCLELSMYC